MPVSDPAQLLQRIPELEPLAEDAKIRKAIESGDAFKVYRALVLAKLFGRLPAHRATLKALVKRRRLFAKPLKGNPALGTFNTVGFSFVGSSESEPDGTHIALHAFVVLQFIPVIPLSSYLVQKTGSSLFSSQWRIFARVPAGPFGWFYSRTLALGLVGFMLWGAGSSYYKSQNQDITVLNGFEVPIDVVLDGKSMTVAPQDKAVITVKVGDVSGSARAKPSMNIDTFQQKVTSQGGYTIWNIAGAAPLVQDRVTYYKTTPANPPADNGASSTIYCGQRFIQISNVDDAFQEPPKSISMSKHQDVATRIHLDVIKFPGQSGASACVRYLISRDNANQASGILEAQAELANWEKHVTNYAVFAASRKSDSEAIRIAQRAVTAKPNDVDLHRIYQKARDEAGQISQLQREYDDRANSQPDSANAQFLRAVLAHGKTGLSEFERLAASFNQDTNILRSLTWRRMAHGDFAGANQSWEKLKRLSPDDAELVVDARVLALLGQKKMRDAVEVLSASMRDPKGEERASRLAELAMVVNLAGGDPRKVISEISKDAQDPAGFDFIRVRAGLEPIQPADKQSPLVKLGLALRDNPENALRFGQSLAHIDFSALGAEQWALLYGEAARTNNKALLTRMERFTSSTSYTDREIFKKFVRGEEVSLDDADLDPEMRAAALLVRSRNTSLSEKERAELRNRAAQSDLLRSVVSSALLRWPV